MLDPLIRTLRRPALRARVVALLRRLGLLGVAFRQYERFQARAAPAADAAAEYDEHGLPLPPADLRVLVAGTPDIPWFLSFGRAMFDTILGAMDRDGSPVSGLERVLEFGCGSGRVLRYWREVKGPDIYATDYNPRPVAWCRQNLPFATIGLNQANPPLAYGDVTFDLVYAISVFTHLKTSLQQQWMADLRRILKPGGHLVLTTHGASFRSYLTPEELARFDAGEVVVRYEETSGQNICSTYHPESFVRRELARGFSVRELIPAGQRELIAQDVYVLRKQPDEDRPTDEGITGASDTHPARP